MRGTAQKSHLFHPHGTVAVLDGYLYTGKTNCETEEEGFVSQIEREHR